MAALSPSASPGAAILRIKVLPSREDVERFTFPEQMMNTPRGVCPSTNRIAPGQRALLAHLIQGGKQGMRKSAKEPGVRSALGAVLNDFYVIRRIHVALHGDGPSSRVSDFGICARTHS